MNARRDRGIGREFVDALLAAAGDRAEIERVLRTYAGATIYLPSTREAEYRRAVITLIESGVERPAAVARLAMRFDVSRSTARRWIARELAQDSKVNARALHHDRADSTHMGLHNGRHA